MTNRSPDLIRITSAPEEYDGFGTTTVEWLDWQSRGGHRFRVVCITPAGQYGNWQLMRYASGMYASPTRDEFDEWVRLKLGVYPYEPPANIWNAPMP